MKFSYNWLKELSGTDKSPEELAKLLLTRAFEVESVERFVHHLPGVVIGEVTKCDPHPDADRLKVTEVRISPSAQSRGPDSSTRVGEREFETYQIVCGAPNVAAGQKVAVALPGTKLPNGAEIRETDIRGVTSRGMICAEDELGMGPDHEGILVLPEDTEVGMPIAEAFGLDDHILDVKILPNRGTDALSHYGLAREIAALEGRTFSAEGLFGNPLPGGIGTGEIGVTIEAKDACFAYAGLSFALSGQPTGLPLPIRGRMLMLGHHPIHPAADIANYLMLLSGQPMHAFDVGKFSGDMIVVRFAKDGETLVTLDDREIVLTCEDLVIADATKPLALAGIMGGKDSAVSKDTGRVFFEIANFDPKTIRRSRVRHGFMTDAAYLFEHAVDPSWPEVLRSEVISRFSGFVGATCTGMTGEFPDTPEARTISFPLTRVRGLLGVAVPNDEALSILRALGIRAEIRDGMLDATAPTFRPDLGREADIIEEIGRVYGYEHIAPVPPLFPAVAVPRNKDKALERSIKRFLVHRGFDEIQTYSFYGEVLMRRSGVPEQAHLRLENPMNPDQRYFRAGLLPNIAEKAVENMSRVERMSLFEFGRTCSNDAGIVSEVKRVAFAVVRKERSAGEAFLDAKGETERLLQHLGLVSGETSFEPAEHPAPLYHPGRVARIVSRGEMLGMIGEAHPTYQKKFGARKIAFVELSFAALIPLAGKMFVMSPIPKFPYVTRDLSVIVTDAVTVREIEIVIREAGAPLLREAEAFDVYRKDGEKSVAFHLVFGADDRTITGEDAEAALRRIQELVAQKCVQ